MIVTHNGTQYTVTRMANQYEWKLTSVTNPRDTLKLNGTQMILAGFKHAMGGKDDKSLRNDPTNSAMH
ncbi:hypothetical protein PUATCC27989T_00446 [Phytobacter ursingii]|nr:hypothetical protein PUATCC27989T_00446 [Phytobacter ursingii]